MRVWDQLGSASICFEATEVGASHLGTILEVDELLRALFRQIGKQPNIRLWSGSPVVSLTEVVGNQRSLVLESGESIPCELIVGADGSRSPLRELADIPTRIRPMGQTAMVAVVVHQHAHRQTAWQSFGKSGPLAFLPLPDGPDGQHQSAIVWSLDDEMAARHQQLEDVELIPLLEAGIDHRLGPISTIRQRATFPLNQLHAQHYVRPGLCLLGDAIHTLHPLAGQGANLGLRDVAALDRELQRAQRRGVQIGHMSILRRYERSRKLENLSMLAGMEAFRHGFGSRSMTLRWLCNQGMRQVNRWGAMKNLLARQAMH
jgi:2-octaprenylphenol hydroxylase